MRVQLPLHQANKDQTQPVASWAPLQDHTRQLTFPSRNAFRKGLKSKNGKRLTFWDIISHQLVACEKISGRNYLLAPPMPTCFHHLHRTQTTEKVTDNVRKKEWMTRKMLPEPKPAALDSMSARALRRTRNVTPHPTSSNFLCQV